MAQKKTLYHSELRDMGPVEVLVDSDLRQSKYRDQNDYYVLVIDGNERFYPVENDDCAKALEGLKGQTVILEATGTREEAQIIVSEPTGDQERAAPRRQAPQQSRPAQGQRERPAPRQERAPAQERQPARQDRPATAAARPKPAGQSDVKKVREFFGRAANGMILALKAAHYVKIQFDATNAELIKAGHAKPIDEEHERAIASSIFIAADRGGQLNWLPSGPLSAAPAPATPVTRPAAPHPAERPQADSRAEAPQPDALGDEQPTEKCKVCGEDKYVDGSCPKCDDVPF